MSVFDCSCYDAETGKVLLKLVGIAEKLKPEELPEGVSADKLAQLKLDLKNCSFDSHQGKGGDGQRAKSGRKLSAYQISMGNCMRSPEKGGQGKPFKECIADYKAKKGG